MLLPLTAIQYHFHVHIHILEMFHQKVKVLRQPEVLSSTAYSYYNFQNCSPSYRQNYTTCSSPCPSAARYYPWLPHCQSLPPTYTAQFPSGTWHTTVSPTYCS